MSHRFCRDLEFERRMEGREEDPFRTRAFDFPLPALDDGAVRRLAAEMVARHDGLRTRVRRTGPGLLEAEPFVPEPAVRVEEVGSLSPGAGDRDAFLQGHAREIHLLDGPVAAFYFLRSRRQNRGLLRLICSHFCMDLGSQRVLARTAAALASGRPERLPAGSGYLDWMDAYHRHATGEAGAREAEFWRAWVERPLSATAAALAGDGGGRSSRSTVEIPEPIAGVLRRSCPGRWNCRAADAIVASAAIAISAELGLETVPFAWTTHGRHPLSGRHFSGTTGWLSNLHPLLVSVDRDRKRVPGALRQSLGSCPTAAALSPGSSLLPRRGRRTAARRAVSHQRAGKRPPAAHRRPRSLLPAGPGPRGEGGGPRRPAAGIAPSALEVDLRRSIRLRLKCSCEKTGELGPRLAARWAEEVYRYAVG